MSFMTAPTRCCHASTEARQFKVRYHRCNRLKLTFRNTQQEIALSALTGGRAVLCVYVSGLMTLQALAPGAMVAIGVEADWAKSDPPPDPTPESAPSKGQSGRI